MAARVRAHGAVAHDLTELLDALTGELHSRWGARARCVLLSKDAPLFEHA
jgi:hypothetical protein